MSEDRDVAGETDKSAGISRRRELLEEVLEERSKAVAVQPVVEWDPRPHSGLWPLGITRVTTARGHPRRRALDAAVVALAWLEACDRLPADRSARRHHDGVG